MRIDILNKIPFSELEEMIRDVPINQKDASGERIKVYRNADISFRETPVNQVNPTSFYLLKGNLDTQRSLREAMLDAHGIDTLHLDAAYEIQNGEEIWTITPPIIEITPRIVQYLPGDQEITYTQPARINIPIINDGLHRVSLAQENDESFLGMHISGADERFPFYAHPNSWNRVKVVDEVPSTKQEKKFYLRENCYELYRDFGTLGVGSPRGTSK